MPPNDQGALTEAVFYILLGLHSPLHGYGIMQFVQELTKDRVVLSPGTLYGALNTLVEKRWIRGLSTSSNSRRKEYTITAEGKRVFAGELTRLRELLSHGELIQGGEG